MEAPVDFARLRDYFDDLESRPAASWFRATNPRPRLPGGNDMNALVTRTLLLAALLAPATASGQSGAQNAIPTQHNEATVAQLQAEMASAALTSERLTQEYITRILALDQNGPGVNAVIELNPDALVMARNTDALRMQGIVLVPLHGIPVLLKASIDTADTTHAFAVINTPGGSTRRAVAGPILPG